MSLAINIPEIAPGSVAVVVGYSRVYGGYIGRLISLGLVPGTCLVILDLNLDRGAVQIMLADKILILAKPEVNALIVEALQDDDPTR